MWRAPNRQFFSVWRRYAELKVIHFHCVTSSKIPAICILHLAILQFRVKPINCAAPAVTNACDESGTLLVLHSDWRRYIRIFYHLMSPSIVLNHWCACVTLHMEFSSVIMSQNCKVPLTASSNRRYPDKKNQKRVPLLNITTIGD